MTENEKIDAFVLEQLGKGDPLKAGELVERGRDAGLLEKPKDRYDSTGTARPIDRALQRLRKAGKIQLLGARVGWALANRKAQKAAAK